MGLLQAADRVKLGVVRDYGVPLLPPHKAATTRIAGEPLLPGAGAPGGGSCEEAAVTPSEQPRPNAVTVRKAAGALLKHRDTMPLDRRRCAPLLWSV